MVAHKVNFKYTDYIGKEEQVFKNVYSLVALRKRLKGKAFGVKGSSNNNPKPNEGEEEAAKKAQEESTRRLAVRAKRLLAEEAQKDQAKVTKQKSIEVVLKKMVELEKALAKGDSNSDQGMQDTGGIPEGQGQDNEEVQGGGGAEQSPVRDNSENLPATSSSILTGGHVPIVEMGSYL